MIKLCIFDLDGVLIDSKQLHFEALNEALAKIDQKYIISFNENLNRFDGMTTKEKLIKLNAEKGLPKKLFDKICENKKNFLYSKIDNVKVNPNIYSILQELKTLGMKLFVASNADKNFVNKMLETTNIVKYFDLVITRDDCVKPKPSSEIYQRAILAGYVEPHEALILEDSLIGQEAAKKSGGNLLVVDGINNLTIDKIKKEIDNCNSINSNDAWLGKNLNIVIAMSGLGSRFSQDPKYKFPKPLIDVAGRPMIQVATEFLKFPNARFIFVIQKSHNEQYNLGYILKLMKPNCEIVEIDGLTEGAACSVLKAKEFINNNDALIISNCDQWMDFNCAHFMNHVINKNADGGIISFIKKENDTKWSYVKTDEEDFALEIKEKQKISDYATCGVYLWRSGKDFVKDAEDMINSNDRVNNEFYVAPTYNYGIKRGLKFLNYFCDKFVGLGTPKDLEDYLESIKK